IFYEMLTYPMSRSEYLLGKVLFNVFIAIVQMVITLGLGATLLRIRLRADLLPLLIVTVVLGTAGWFFFFFLFLLLILRIDIFNSVTSVFYFVFLFASSMFYPLDPLPQWFRVIGLANPITWQVDLLRYTSIGLGNPHQLGLEAIAFAIFVVACFGYAVHSLK